jgi:hypothetical protein
MATSVLDSVTAGLHASRHDPIQDWRPALPDFQDVAVPVTVTGLGFFDFAHGQRGVAPNAIELHPVIGIVFNG